MKNAKRNVSIYIRGYTPNSDFTLSEWLKARELCNTRGTDENKIYISLKKSIVKERE